MASIALHDITKVFDRRTVAVSQVTLDVADGELLVLVGPSGCGKTTILRLIAGLETPTAGAIHIGGKAVTEVPPRARDLALVFQDGVLYPHMTVFANLAFPLRMRGLDRHQVQRRVEAAAALLGLADLLQRKPAALSGGQRQRVALGRALVREPAAFLFDEPLSSLDVELRRALRHEIKTLHERLRTTMLYVTHDQSEAMALGERVCVLREGRLQQVGHPLEVYDRPVNRFVAGFFGAPPMNFLRGRLRREQGVGLLDWAGGRLPVPSSWSDGGEQAVLVGVRPHDLSVEPALSPDAHRLAGRVSVLEPFGSRTDIHFVLASGEKCVLCAPPHVPLTVGQEIRVHVDPRKLRLFHPDGAALEAPACR
ncbi:MAG: ABC transporter ATP-binding protein [Planctomycetes bacterium]|jgi:multiple sugar transport system ATP-binding protein|nr:ABC transporter ATP-binding protein [Planctomycetota bacterium]